MSDEINWEMRTLGTQACSYKNFHSMWVQSAPRDQRSELRSSHDCVWFSMCMCGVISSVHQLPFLCFCVSAHSAIVGSTWSHRFHPLFRFLHVFLYLFLSITKSYFFQEKLSSLYKAWAWIFFRGIQLFFIVRLDKHLV